jgi:hypothetical protein
MFPPSLNNQIPFSQLVFFKKKTQKRFKVKKKLIYKKKFSLFHWFTGSNKKAGSSPEDFWQDHQYTFHFVTISRQDKLMPGSYFANVVAFPGSLKYSNQLFPGEIN